MKGSEDRAAPTPLRSRTALVWVGATVFIAIVYLRWQGRIWWCQCGRPYPISIHVNSQHNSQHVFDPYSLSHVLHGVLFFGVLWLFRRRLSLNVRGIIAAAIEIGWEMLENSPIVINRYRTATAAMGYTGDSIINSLGDIASFVLGFYFARKLGLWKSVALFFVVELLMLWLMRDNLTLNVLMLLWPIDAVRKWQSAG
jgi:Protein of unknown function (DUF2585)